MEVKYSVELPILSYLVLVGCLLLMPQLICEAKSCPPPDFPERGRYDPELKEYETGMLIEYFCNKSRPMYYKNSIWNPSQKVVGCKSSGKWSEPTIYCALPAKLKNLIDSPYAGSRDFFVIDDDVDTCFGPVKDQEILKFSLGAKLIPFAVLVCYSTGGRGKFNIRFTPAWNVTYDTDWGGLLNTCALFTTLESPSKTDTITVEISSKTNSSVSLCEMDIYARDENWCFEPPESVPNGQLEVSPTKAVLHCNEDFREKDGKAVYATCRENKWLYHSLECVDKSQANNKISVDKSTIDYKIPAVAGGSLVAIIIVIIIGVKLLFISRKKPVERPVILKRFDNDSNSTTSVGGQTISSSSVAVNSNIIL